MSSTHPPLFIVGAPRSGNTLTRRVLMASGQIYIPPETYVFGEILTRWRAWSRLPWQEQVWLACAYFDRHEHFEDFEIDSFTPLAEQVVAFPKGQRSVKDFFEALYVFMGRAHGFDAPRWGDKTPWNTVYLKQIVKAYPEAYFLYLKRDGRDVVASQIKAGMRDIPQSAQRWVDANQACLKHLRRTNRPALDIAYEDLVRTPEPVFRRIFEWAELDFEPEFLTRVPTGLADVDRHAHHQAVTQPINDKSIGRWTQSLSGDDFAGLSPEFTQMMQTLGYGAVAGGQ